MVGIHIHLLPVFKAPKTAKGNAAAKKCCGWEEPAICEPFHACLKESLMLGMTLPEMLLTTSSSDGISCKSYSMVNHVMLTSK